MQAVNTGVALMRVVLSQLVSHTVECELAVADAVGIAANAGTVVGGRVQRVGILGYVVEAQHYVSRLAVLVGNNERHHAATIVGDAHLHAVLVLQRVELHWLVLESCVKLGRVETRYRELRILLSASAGREHCYSNAHAPNTAFKVFHCNWFLV